MWALIYWFRRHWLADSFRENLALFMRSNLAFRWLKALCDARAHRSQENLLCNMCANVLTMPRLTPRRNDVKTQTFFFIYIFASQCTLVNATRVTIFRNRTHYLKNLLSVCESELVALFLQNVGQSGISAVEDRDVSLFLLF